MSLSNKVILKGNIGQQPQLRQTGKGTPVLNFSMATNEKIDSERTHTEWHDIVVWGNRAMGLERVLNKGDQVLVEGRLRKREFEQTDSETGVVSTKTRVEIHLDELEFCGGKPPQQDDRPRSAPRQPRPQRQQRRQRDDYGWPEEV